jgi:hypothetical protein
MTVLFLHQPGDRVQLPLVGGGTVGKVGELYIDLAFYEGERLCPEETATIKHVMAHLQKYSN